MFWAPRIETNRTVTIPFAFEQCERTDRVDHFVRAAQVLRGEEPANRKPPGYPFDDTDVYKVIEGASYTLSVHPDPKLDAYVDGLIAKIAAAQEPDGYLYTTRTINPKQPHPWAGPERWVLERDDSHELYNLGHLFEAAVAHYLATGKRSLLDVAVEAADLLVRTFGPGKRSIWPGHQITEMGLVKMCRVTGEPAVPRAGEVPARRARARAAAAGRARQPARARLQPGAAARRRADRAGRPRRARDLHVLGHGRRGRAHRRPDATSTPSTRSGPTPSRKKLYITGGIGATGAGEAFGSHYELPNMTAYNETCAVDRHGLLEPPAVPAARRRASTST